MTRTKTSNNRKDTKNKQPNKQTPPEKKNTASQPAGKVKPARIQLSVDRLQRIAPPSFIVQHTPIDESEDKVIDLQSVHGTRQIICDRSKITHISMSISTPPGMETQSGSRVHREQTCKSWKERSPHFRQEH